MLILKQNIKMELLYFISGVLFVGVIYGINLLRKVKSSHADLLARHQSHSNISSIRNMDIGKELEDLKLLIMDIQSNMEEDQYKNLSGINKSIEELSKAVYGSVEKMNQSNTVFEKNIKEAFNEIQQIKVSIKALGQDPNMLSRY